VERGDGLSPAQVFGRPYHAVPREGRPVKHRTDAARDGLVAGCRRFGMPDDALNRNVSGRRLTGALQGFGRLWRKIYTVPLGAVTPQAVITAWKKIYSEFWTSGDRLYTPFTTLEPGM